MSELRLLPIALVCLALVGGLSSAGVAHAADAHTGSPPPKPVPAAAPPAAPATPAHKEHKEAKPAGQPAASGDPQRVVDRIRAALATHAEQDKLHVLVGDEPLMSKSAAGHAPVKAHTGGKTHTATASHATARTAALTGHDAPAAHGGAVHWAYAGEHGPERWGQIKPEFNLCALGKRQSPIHIERSGTLQGPAEPLKFDYRPTGGSVVNNGHTIQVDLDPGNTLTTRGSTYQLLQFHFHHPSEERVNHKGFAMVAHLVHRNDMGQLAVVAVLMDPGEANALIHKVWTHMPLDSGDRVPLPTALIDLRELLPADQRYFQFIGSLTTPPCTEGVLWNVLKQPVSLSAEQLRLFAQMFPMNARPVQALNGRAVREAQ